MGMGGGGEMGANYVNDRQTRPVYILTGTRSIVRYQSKMTGQGIRTRKARRQSTCRECSLWGSHNQPALPPAPGEDAGHGMTVETLFFLCQTLCSLLDIRRKHEPANVNTCSATATVHNNSSLGSRPSPFNTRFAVF